MIDVNKILQMSISLTSERDYNKILEKIVLCAMDLTNCEGGTLYLFKDDELHYLIMRNIFSGIQKNEGKFPPVQMTESNMSAYSAIHRTMVNIPDVYHSKEFDFSGPKNYDKTYHYQTMSMLAFPLINHEEKLIGVVQLINARNKKEEKIPFSDEHEVLLQALASMAAVSLSNMQYIEQIQSLLHAIVNVFTNAIDARTPYNYYHSQNVHHLVQNYINYHNRLFSEGKVTDYIDYDHREEMELAALMHDIGKLVTPLSVMNKETRLSEKLSPLLLRLKYIQALKKAEYLEGTLSEGSYREELAFLSETGEMILKINKGNFLTDDEFAFVERLSEKSFTELDGTVSPYLSKEEAECLKIRKGTLTDAEREQMKLHVVYTERFLKSMNFDEHYEDVRNWASKHHELLDGSGYPNGLKAEELPKEARLLTIADVYDALTSDDRPYKKAHTRESALSILGRMAADGQIDSELLERFSESLQYQDNGKVGTI